MSRDDPGWPHDPPDPTGWLTVAEAADRLERPEKYVRRRVNTGYIASTLHRRRRWVAVATVEAILAERERWLSYKAAAALLDVSDTTVARLVHAGVLVSRHAARRRSIDRASVEAAAVQLEQARATRDAAVAEVARLAELEAADTRVWFDTVTTALVLGVTANRVRQMSVADRIPFDVHRGRRRYLREHVEQLAAARAFAAGQIEKKQRPPPRRTRTTGAT